VVFVSSLVGLLAVQAIPAHAASKHAVQSIAEAMYEGTETLRNSGPSGEVNFIRREAFQKVTDGLIGSPEGRLDPREMISKMVEVIPAREGKFFNIVPPSSEDWFKSYHQRLLDRTI
jgi:hypothetical protein